MDNISRKPRHKATYDPRFGTPEQKQRNLDRQKFAQAYHRRLIATNQNRCAICGWIPPTALHILTTRALKPFVIELHHILPISVGGTDTEDNIIPLCPNHHRIADILSGISDIGGRKATGFRSKVRLSI